MQGRLGAWVTTAAVGVVAVGAAVGSAVTASGTGRPARPAASTRPGGGTGTVPGTVRATGPASSPPARSVGTTTAGSAGSPARPGNGTAGSSGRGAPAPTSSGGSPAGRGGSSALTVDARAWSGHGTLALVTAGQLRLVSGAGQVLAVAGPPGGGSDADPAWAPDHRWLAFVHLPAGGGPPTLWVLRATGGRALQVGTNPVGTFAWSPFADQLAFVTVDAATGAPTVGHNLWTDLPGGEPVALGAVPADEAVRSLAWSPDGQQLAVDEVSLAPGSTPATPVYGDDVLVMVPTGGGPAVEEYASSTGGLQVAGWWPSGTGILFWADPGFAGGAAGLPLESLPLGGHTPTLLGTTLAGPGFVAPAPAGGPDEVAVVLGAGRGVADSGRHVAVCTLPAGTCRPVPEPTGRVGLAPAWTAASGLLLVTAPSTGTAGPAGADGSGTAMAAWDAASRLQVAAPPDWSPADVGAAGGGVVWADPAATGSEALVVRDDALWLVDLAGGGPLMRVAGPLFTPVAPRGVAGRVDWGAAFAWSEAPVAGAVAPDAPWRSPGELP